MVLAVWVSDALLLEFWWCHPWASIPVYFHSPLVLHLLNIWTVNKLMRLDLCLLSEYSVFFLSDIICRFTVLKVLKCSQQCKNIIFDDHWFALIQQARIGHIKMQALIYLVAAMVHFRGIRIINVVFVCFPENFISLRGRKSAMDLIFIYW